MVAGICTLSRRSDVDKERRTRMPASQSHTNLRLIAALIMNGRREKSGDSVNTLAYDNVVSVGLLILDT